MSCAWRDAAVPAPLPCSILHPACGTATMTDGLMHMHCRPRSHPCSISLLCQHCCSRDRTNYPRTSPGGCARWRRFEQRPHRRVTMIEAEGPLQKSEVDRIIDNGIEEEYGRLRQTPGFCIDAVSWNRLEELIRIGTEESLGRLGRTPTDIGVYRQFRQRILHQYRSVADYVQVTKLDFDSVEDEDGIRQAGHPPPDKDGRPHVTFHQNDFPYNFDEGMQHHNIWCTRPLSDGELAEVIRQHRAGWEVLFFRNPESLASIPSVWHGHVVSRQR